MRDGFASPLKGLVICPPIEYPTRWRMLSAGDMLERPDLPVLDIAVRAGYESETTFSRAFKRAFNMSPARYRQHVFDAGHSAMEAGP
jgi:AraC family transcriptional regulator, alkane utilization regulator